MITKHFGKFYSLNFFRDRCNITKEGASFLDLSYAAEDVGLKSLSLKCTTADLLNRIPLPAIVHWDKSHFVVVYKSQIKKKWFTRDLDVRGILHVADPAVGFVKYDSKVFEKKWLIDGNTGSLMAFEPQADFFLIGKEEPQRKGRGLERFINYFKPYHKSFMNLLIVMMLMTIFQGFLPFISKSIIDVGIQTNDLQFINLVFIANASIIVSILLSNIVRDWILLHITSRVNIALISDFLIKLMRLPITFFENKMMGDILQRAQDHERIRAFLMNNSLNMLFSALTFIVFSVILLNFNLGIFFIFAIGSIIYIVWVLAFLKVRKKLDYENFELISKNQSYWVEVITCIQDIKINNYEKQKRWKWEALQAKIYEVNKKILNVTNIQSIGAQFVDSLKNLLITVFCAKAVIAGDISLGVMISTQFIIGMLNGPVTQFIQFIISFEFAKISFLRLNEIHESKDEHEDITSNHFQYPASKNLTFKNVSFKYTTNGNLVLKNMHFVIPEGKVTAIVGDSGSGKSTLLKLLLRLYSPSFGSILMGNMDINNINLRQWREKCGAVMQDGKIFNDTILNNIILEADKVDYEKLKRALQTSNIEKEIEELPLGYNTILGEQGKGLSGGQKQRILIARALYKDPDFLFFDEATNSLDAINEQKIVTALDQIFKDKTVVVIAHRLSTINKADQIIVMQEGNIVEVGNHQTLMSKKGRYFQLVDSQLNISPGAKLDLQGLI